MTELAVSISRLRIADPDGLVGAIRGSDLEPWLLSGHRSESELSRIMLPGSCLDHAIFGPAMWFRGVMPKDCYTMVYVTACPEEGHSFNFKSRHRDKCLGFFAPGETLDAKTPEGYGHATLTIPETVFLEVVESCHQEFPEGLLKQGGSFFPTADACWNLTAFLDAMNETMRHTPDVLASGAVRDVLECELHDHFLGLIRSDRGNGSAANNPRITRRYRRMNLLQDFIRENSRRRIRLAELCAVSGLSRRGLEYLFADQFGVRTQAFLHQSRMHGVRRELLASEPRHGLVKKVALNWGFWHLGRFAADYRALFDENPSATLARRRS